MAGKGKDQRKSATVLGGADYRNGAAERLEDARVLLDEGRFAGGIYMAGRAVEAILRAVIWTRDPEIRQGRKSLETGHDLRDLLALVANLGLLTARRSDDEFKDRVARVSQRWFNNMRFASSRVVETRWVRLTIVRRGMTLKQAAEQYFDDCSEILKRCEKLWQP